MITKWKLFNFKSIQTETEFDFGPLTIFAGANSAGKSSILQSILLISQTLSSKIKSNSVVLNGHYVKLGQFDDLKSFDSDADQVLIGWQCEPIEDRRWAFFRKGMRVPAYRTRMKKVLCEISFDTKSLSLSPESIQLRPSLFNCIVSSVMQERDQTDYTSNISITRSKDHYYAPIQTEEDELEDGNDSPFVDDFGKDNLAFDIIVDNQSLDEYSSPDCRFTPSNHTYF